MPDNVRIDVSGITRVLREEPGRVADWLDSVAEEMVGDVKESFGTSPPGRTYQRGAKTHVSSQPGYPPNVDTGTLRASIRWDRISPFTREIMDGVEYGIELEDGTERIQARPFMGPVFYDWRRRIESHARQHLRID